MKKLVNLLAIFAIITILFAPAPITVSAQSEEEATAEAETTSETSEEATAEAETTSETSEAETTEAETTSETSEEGTSVSTTSEEEMIEQYMNELEKEQRRLQIKKLLKLGILLIIIYFIIKKF